MAIMTLFHYTGSTLNKTDFDEMSKKIKSINEQNDDLEEQIESKNRRTAKNPDISRYRIIDKIDSNLLNPLSARKPEEEEKKEEFNFIPNKRIRNLTSKQSGGSLSTFERAPPSSRNKEIEDEKINIDVEEIMKEDTRINITEDISPNKRKWLDEESSEVQKELIDNNNVRKSAIHKECKIKISKLESKDSTSELNSRTS